MPPADQSKKKKAAKKSSNNKKHSLSSKKSKKTANSNPKSQKKPVGKIESRYNSTDFDYISDKDLNDWNSEKKIEENKKNAQKNKNDALENSEISFRGKLMQMFAPTEPKELIKHQTHPLEEAQTKGYIPQDYTYIQMRLNLEDISEEFSKELEQYRISGIKIRKASMQDLPIFVKLYNRAFMRGSDPWSPATEDQFKEILAHETTVVLIASIGEEDVGFIIIDLEENPNNENGGKTGVICGLGTDPRWQRRGIARFLGMAAWDYFKQRDVKELRCEVYENNRPSYNLIKSLHFEEVGKKVYQF